MPEPRVPHILPTPIGRRRPAALHWIAWLLSMVALAVQAVAMFAQVGSEVAWRLAFVDVAMTVIFAFEFFTRSGWRNHRARYLRWRWFDFVAMVPAALGVVQGWPTWILWVVLGCRVLRALDRSLGDGFVLKQVLVLVTAFEEELSDRVVDRVLVRWQAEIAKADFGHTAAEALHVNREPILKRIYEVQLKTGTLGRLVQLTGMRGNIEREEALLFDEVVAIMGSAEVDKAIRDVVAASFASIRVELGKKSWRGQLGHAPAEPV
ncbi:MAG: hypothetical protein V4510_05480 [bacterium]